MSNAQNNPAANNAANQQQAQQAAQAQQQPQQQQQAAPQQPPGVTLLGYDAQGNPLYGKPAHPPVGTMEYYGETLKKVGYVLAGAALGAVGYKVYQNRQLARQQRQLLLSAPSTPQDNMTYDR